MKVEKRDKRISYFIKAGFAGYSSTSIIRMFPVAIHSHASPPDLRCCIQVGVRTVDQYYMCLLYVVPNPIICALCSSSYHPNNPDIIEQTTALMQKTKLIQRKKNQDFLFMTRSHLSLGLILPSS